MQSDFLLNGLDQAGIKDELMLFDTNSDFDLCKYIASNPQGNVFPHFQLCILFVQLKFIC